MAINVKYLILSHRLIHSVVNIERVLYEQSLVFLLTLSSSRILRFCYEERLRVWNKGKKGYLNDEAEDRNRMSWCDALTMNNILDLVQWRNDAFLQKINYRKMSLSLTSTRDLAKQFNDDLLVLTFCIIECKFLKIYNRIVEISNLCYGRLIISN